MPAQRATARAPGPPAPAWSGAGAVQAKAAAARRPVSAPLGKSTIVQRKLMIGAEEYDSNDSEFLYEKIYANCFSRDVKLISKTLSGHLRRNERFVDMTSFLWTLNMELFEAEKPKTFSMQEVQKKIFQYWAGGALSPGAARHVEEWIAKAKESGWVHHFVTDEKINKKFYDKVLIVPGMFINTHIHLQDQIKRFATLGSKIIDAADFKESSQYMTLQKQTLKEGSFSHIPFMSDLIRFYLLHRFGGLYMDVDVAPGSVQLGSYMTMGNIPYLGPMLRTTQDARDKGVFGAKGSTLERKLLGLFGKEDPARGMHYMMSAKGSPAMKEIFNIANTTNVLGNGAVMAGIDRHFRKNIGVSDFNDVMTLTLPLDLPRIGWITSESDNIVN